MENKIEEYLVSILEDMVLERKEEGFIGQHGSRKDDELIYFTYYDEYKGVWTTYDRAVEGYVFTKLKPIIDKILK